ncbi:hypothetical protein K1719_023141 [Acacia pycnantha]|nr:hypothetical protein K1719_023141 [Acacia pycnantha]
MEKVAWDLAKALFQCFSKEAREELKYLFNYKSYVEGFEKERGRLPAVVGGVKLKIHEANKENKTIVHPIVEDWLKRAEKLVQHDPQPTKCFGLYTNCFSQIEQAKKIEKFMKEDIPNLIAEVKGFPEVAHAVGVPGMEYHSQEFMSFESRMAKFEELKKALEDENEIGLLGMGGTGKSTMAIEVGKHVEKSNLFDRVIFIEVSAPVDEKRIRDEIAKKLELQLEEENPLSLAQQIWNKIASSGMVLIILDNVWEKLYLKNMGIQPRIHSKGRCCVLLTSRYEDVCTQMSFQKRIKLEALPGEDALKLFFFHAMKNSQGCPDTLKNVAMGIVNECGRLPVIVVPVAKVLNDCPTDEWQDALERLKSDVGPSRYEIVGEDEEVKKFYNFLKLSYTHLKDEKAQELFLLCSIFPKAYEIPVDLLCRVAIGIDKYDTSRSQVRGSKNKLINSSLLLKANEECVKLHDVIRKVALEVWNEEIQVITDSNTKLKANMKYSSWIINDGFPNCFDGSKLKVLLVWLNANSSLEVPDAIFGGMKSLRVLLLHSKIEYGRTSALSLSNSIQSLKDIRTLSLKNWELGNISKLMKNLKKLESLELTNCSIDVLPNEIIGLDKLRFLYLKSCLIEENNPFEVIARCSQLEELYYVSNDDHILIEAKAPQITSLPECKIYHIDGSNFSAFDSSQLDTSIKRCFKPGKLQKIFSKELTKSLATRAEILELEGDDEIGWNDLIPSIVSIGDRGMKDLIKLSLKKCYEMKCLIHTEYPQLRSGATYFSELVELQLFEVDVREICYGSHPDGFLRKLEKLELKNCQKLESTLFKDKLALGNLKSIYLEECSMMYLFHPSTAQSLTLLETLKIVNCSKLQYIIRDEESSVEENVDDEDCNHESIFSKLKLLSVQGCEALEFILPICFCEDLPLLESVELSKCKNLRYMFDQYSRQGGLYKMHNENTLRSLKVMSIDDVPLYVNIYSECYLPQKSIATSEGSKEKDKDPSRNVSWWDPLSCFLPKSETTNKDEPSTSEIAQPDHIASQGKYVGNRANNGIFTPPLYPCNLRAMNVRGISNLRSLFSISIASSMLLLEELVVSDCDELEHIVTEEVDGHHHMNPNSIFPNLRTIEINVCGKLEYVFPASCSRNLVRLESLLIYEASQLKYVFGKSCDDDNSPHENQSIEIDLSALNKLSLERVPKMPIGMQFCNLKCLTLKSMEMETMYDLERLQIASPVDSSLESLRLEDLNMLRNICVVPKHHLSFQNLSKLIIYRCHQMKFILSAPISRSLPYLRYLSLSECKELERIIEDDDEECCFPNLVIIHVEDCKSLKCLFSISICGSLPQLLTLLITRVPELEQVFERKQGTTQELDIKHVFPELFMIGLAGLPKLHTICSTIDFHTITIRKVMRCPNISLTSAHDEFLGSYWDWLNESEGDVGNEEALDTIEQMLNRVIQLGKKTIKRDPPTAKQNNGSTYIKEIAEASDEESPESGADEGKYSAQTNKPVPFVDPSQIESPQETMEPISQEGSKLDEVALTTNQIMEPESSKSSPTAFVVYSENECPHDNLVGIEGKGKGTTLDHQVLPKTEHDMHPHDSKKDIETCVGERSEKWAMGSPSTTTEKSPPLIPSIFTSEKPQIATSSTDETKLKSSQSDLLDAHVCF